jgi:GNAT superfamily N-acetyltransferase
MALELRRMRPEELDACAELYQRVLRATFTWQPPERHRREDFIRFARDEEVYVAARDGVVVAVAGFYRPQSFLHSLYADERGRGVGKALLDHVAANCTGPLALKVQTRNLRALAFYEREGFIRLDSGEDDGVQWTRLIRKRP